MNELAGLRRILVAVARTVVYVAGMVFGFLVALIVGSFGGSFTTDFFGIFFGLGLMLAAPICWVAAIKSSKGDRWTLGYIGGWAVFFLIGYVTSTIEDGQPIKVSDNAVNWGLAALAVFYFLILPTGVILYRRRRTATER